LFEKIKVKSLNYKTSELPNRRKEGFTLPALTAGILNQGLNNFVPKENATILRNMISISANGANTGATFYQNKEFTVLQDAYAIQWKKHKLLNDYQYLYFVSSISKVIFGNYEWTNKAGWEKIKNNKIKLPIKNNEIDFSFMENFIEELERAKIQKLDNYLEINNLKDYTLTQEEQKVLDDFEKKNFQWKEFNLKVLFGESTRGKRLKSADRVQGNLPFVTAGETDEGISAFIGNKVNVFAKNTITIDMFGSAKYRNYEYGADDHVSVVHTENIEKSSSVFITSAIHKASYTGEFHYGRNFYPKDADNLTISLPTKNNQPDYALMQILISAIQKQVVKDVVLYAEKKLGKKI
jgi:hypothetical protein